MFVKFENAGLSDSGKTQRWLVTSTGGAHLGTVSWYSQWRRYAFQPIAGTVFDANCLREIADFLQVETEAQQADKN